MNLNISSWTYFTKACCIKAWKKWIARIKNSEAKDDSDKNDPEVKQIQQIYSIKDITANKNEMDIIDLIRNELGVVEDEVSIWSKMINTISRVSISDNPSLNG